ncbi:MAG TPA: chemotaxis protein CheX [Phycisphaerae bacterium]|nr:chemotaxis protein CheX [Phycisphaerae bacterium]
MTVAVPPPTVSNAAAGGAAPGVELVIHFMKAIKEVLSTMAGVEVTTGKPGLKQDPVSTYDVSGIIGFSGNFGGSMVLSFKKETAVALVKGFSGMEMTPDSPDFTDAVGELANMIAGAAKTQFGGGTSISVPSVILGQGHVIGRLHDVPCIVIPCESAAGAFAVEVSIKSKQ